MKEIWLPVAGHEETHEISSFGQVRSKARQWMGKTPTGFPAKHLVSPKTLKQSKTSKGYMRVSICLPGKPPSGKLVHRLVALTFLGENPELTQVNHKDGDKTNNRLENLEWSNASLNQEHAISHGLVTIRRGSERAFAKLTEQHVRAIKVMLSKGFNQRRIAEIFEIAPCKITMIKQGKSWSHVTLDQ